MNTLHTHGHVNTLHTHGHVNTLYIHGDVVNTLHTHGHVVNTLHLFMQPALCCLKKYKIKAQKGLTELTRHSTDGNFHWLTAFFKI